MFSAVFGLVSHDLAVDLGSTRTRLHRRGVGIICDEPTVMAVHTDRRGKRNVVALGDAARPMIGRVPEDYAILQPIRESRVADFEAAEAFLLHLVRRSHGRNRWMRPRMVVAVPPTASDMETRALRDSCESAGAREVHMVPRPVAAGRGAGLPVDRAAGHLVVDLGGGTTEVAIVALGGVVSAMTVPGGGEALDEAIIRWLRRERELLVGLPTAERLKETIGTVDPQARVRSDIAKGRCLRRGVPRGVTVRSDELREALLAPLQAIASAIRATVERAPAELATDIVDNGVVLTGGGARLDGIEQALRQATGLPVVAADSPDQAVVRGVGEVLERALGGE